MNRSARASQTTFFTGLRVLSRPDVTTSTVSRRLATTNLVDAVVDARQDTTPLFDLRVRRAPRHPEEELLEVVGVPV